MKVDTLRLFVLVIIGLYLQACVSTSLEDAAPTSVVSSPTNLDAASPTPTTQAVASENVQTVPVSEQNITSTVPLSTSVPPNPEIENFPTFATDPKGETSQLSAAEKAVIEARMTEVLLARESDPRIRASYEARLIYLRRLAKSHGAAAQVEIQK